ncbi:MAG: queuosine precursor transporter [Candidatus Babeliales bacterium]
MINELLFIIHIALISICLLGALRFGKEALIALITLYCILANSFVLKQMTICSFQVTCTDAFMVGTVLGLNLLQEYFGKPIARKAIAISFAASILYALLGILHICYAPSAYDMYHASYVALLTPVPRIVLASLFVYLLVQITDYYIFGALKKIFGSRYLIARLWITIALTQLLDTVLFSFLGLYGIVDNISQLIIVSYTIKMLVLVGSTPFMALSKKIVKEPIT